PRRRRRGLIEAGRLPPGPMVYCRFRVDEDAASLKHLAVLAIEHVTQRFRVDEDAALLSPIPCAEIARSHMMTAMRAWSARLVLIAAAVVPFAPAAAQFVRRGVPDYLYTGDAAVLELR